MENNLEDPLINNVEFDQEFLGVQEEDELFIVDRFLLMNGHYK